MHIYLIIADTYINLKSREDKTYENPYLNLYLGVNTFKQYLFDLSIAVVRTVEILSVIILRHKMLANDIK